MAHLRTLARAALGLKGDARRTRGGGARDEQRGLTVCCRRVSRRYHQPASPLRCASRRWRRRDRIPQRDAGGRTLLDQLHDGRVLSFGLRSSSRRTPADLDPSPRVPSRARRHLPLRQQHGQQLVSATSGNGVADVTTRRADHFIGFASRAAKCLTPGAQADRRAPPDIRSAAREAPWSSSSRSPD